MCLNFLFCTDAVHMNMPPAVDLAENPIVQNAGAPVAKQNKRKSRRKVADDKPFRMSLNRLRLADNCQIERPVRTTRNRLP